MRRPLLLISFLTLSACDDPLGTWLGDDEQWKGGDETGLSNDQDGDGYTVAAGDCDDFDPSVHPGAIDGLLTERSCDGVISSDNLSVAEYGFLGEEEDDHAGRAVSSAGDVDGDGLDDILIGAWKSSDGGSNAGKTYLILASSLVDSSKLTEVHQTQVDLAGADYAFTGAGSDQYSGHSVASAGDVDDDGLDDIIIGVENDDQNGSDAGKACIFRGGHLSAKGDLSIESAQIHLLGESAADKAGRAVSSAGDVDGDGLADVLVGAFGNDQGGENAGKVYVVYGSSFNSGTATYYLEDAAFYMLGEGSGENAGYAVSSAGDVDGDGYSDVLIGATGNDEAAENAGKAYLVFGSNMNGSGADEEGVDLEDADHSFLGEETDDSAGRSVTGGGDVDGDGLDDVMIGAWKNGGNGTESGKAYVVLGSALPGDGATSQIELGDASYSFVGASAEDYAGTSAALSGDVDGDGLSDVLVGAYGTEEGAGSLYLLLGANLSASMDSSFSDYAFHGENSSDFAGNSISYAGDVDGNGRDDILVGAWAHNGNRGKTYLVLSGL